MFNAAAIVAQAFGDHLAETYISTFGERAPDYAPTLRTLAQLAVERIASSDALYHDAQHTMQVTLVGQEIMRGRMMVQTVTPEDWLHFTVATLCHDIGYLRGIIQGDGEGRYVVDGDGRTVTAPRGASDAFLTPWHVERGKIFVRHRLKTLRPLDPERVARAIELTRFPVPEGDDHCDTDTEPALVRASDLIGQLADPDHSRKQTALFCEFQETGKAKELGYLNPADVAERYPKFFWSSVEPFVGDAIRHLERTTEGKQWVAQLYKHVFVEEHGLDRPGPERARVDAG